MTAESFELELALDRLVAALEPAVAVQLGAWWRATVSPSPSPSRSGALPRFPPSPPQLALASTRRCFEQACHEPALRAVALPWWRLALTAAVEADDAVAAAASEPPSWTDLGPLAEARNRAAQRLGFDDFPALAGIALGVPAAGDDDDAGDSGQGDLAVGADGDRPGLGTDDLPPCEPRHLLRVLAELGQRYGVDTACVQVGRGHDQRTFVIAPGRDIRVVVSGSRTLAAWRGAVHELGHGLVGASGRWPSRTVDETVATWVADHLTDAGHAAWILGPTASAGHAAIAAAARHARGRRRRAARVVAAFESALYRDPAGDLAARWHRGTDQAGWERRWAVPPAPLWSDPGAQAAYRRAEQAAPALTAEVAAARAAGRSLADVIAEADAGR